MDTISFSPLALFLGAGLVVKLVMTLLVLASVWGWYLIAAAFMLLRRMRSQLLQPGLDAASFAARLVEMPHSRPASRAELRRAGNRILRAAQGGLTDLAVIASIAPFIGLFGTVWGIMTAFTGIAEAQDVGLAVVAPGIAEALAATAYGLAAAIPASIGYSRLGAAFAAFGADLADRIDSHSSPAEG